MRLKEINGEVKQKIPDELNRIELTKQVTDMKKKIRYLNLTYEEFDVMDPIVDYVDFVCDIYEKAVTKLELFDALKYEQFINITEDHNLSEDQMESMNELLDTSIANAETNKKLIEESFGNEDFEKMAETVETKRKDLEIQIKEFIETIAELQLQPRDEEAIDKVRDTNLVEISKISGEMYEFIDEEYEKPNNTLLTVCSASKEMADTQKALIEAIAQA